MYTIEKTNEVVSCTRLNFPIPCWFLIKVFIFGLNNLNEKCCWNSSSVVLLLCCGFVVQPAIFNWSYLYLHKLHFVRSTKNRRSVHVSRTKKQSKKLHTHTTSTTVSYVRLTLGWLPLHPLFRSSFLLFCTLYRHIWCASLSWSYFTCGPPYIITHSSSPLLTTTGQKKRTTINYVNSCCSSLVGRT